MAAVTTDQSTSIFYVKSSGAKASVQKNKVVKKESQIKVAAQNEQIIHSSIQNESSLNVIYGSIYSIRRTQAKLLDDAGKVLKDIVLGGVSQDGKVASKAGKKLDDQYQVMGIEEEGNAKVNNILSVQNGQMRQLVPQSLQLSLLHSDDDIESKLTSVSSKTIKMTKSLGTVLGQALTADDTETLDWVLSNRDDSTVTNTLLSIKDPKLIGSLFKQIVIKFQSQELGKQ